MLATKTYTSKRSIGALHGEKKKTPGNPDDAKLLGLIITPWALVALFAAAAVFTAILGPARGIATTPVVAGLVLASIGFSVLGYMAAALQQLLADLRGITNHVGQLADAGLAQVGALSLKPRAATLVNLVVGLNRVAAAADELHQSSFEAVGGNRMLARELQRTWQLLDSLSEGLIVIDAVGNIIFANQASSEFLNTPLSAVSGKSAHQCVRDTALAAQLQETAESAAARPQMTMDLAASGAGAVANTSVLISLASNQGGVPVGKVLLFKDVSRIKAAESVQVSLLDNLARVVGARLASICKTTEELTSNELPEAEKAALQASVISQTGQFGKLMDSLIENAKIATGMVQVRTEPLPLRPILMDSLAEIRAACVEKEIDLVAELSERLPSVNVDRKYFEIALRIILRNAEKFTPRGGSIIVTAVSHESEFHICIRDTGIGIAKEDLPKIMDRFFLSRSSGVHGQESVGVGLNTAVGIIRLHGGDIRVSSKPGQGSHFSIIFPRSIIHSKA